MDKKIISFFNKLETIHGFGESTPFFSKNSAVLVPIFCPYEDWFNDHVNLLEWRVLFTVRAKHLRLHGGEVSFPGGKVLPNEKPLTAAIRESDEEISLNKKDIVTTFKLNDSFARSGFRIKPYCALLYENVELFCNESEVSCYFLLSFRELLNIPCWSEERKIMKMTREVWHFPIFIKEVGKLDIWGATGNILKDLILRISHFVK